MTLVEPRLLLCILALSNPCVNNCTYIGGASLAAYPVPGTHEMSMSQTLTILCAFWMAPNAGDKLSVIYRHYTSIYRHYTSCLLYTSPSPRDRQKSRMPSSA